MADGADLVLLTTFDDSGMAGALRSRLEAEGIPCVLQGEQHRAMLGFIYGAAIDVRVLVPEAALERARKLLESGESGDAAEGDEEDASEAPQEGAARCADHGGPSIGTCLRCGAFVCEACVGGATGELLCPSCESRASDVEMARHPARRRAFATLLLAFILGPILLALLFGGLRLLRW